MALPPTQRLNSAWQLPRFGGNPYAAGNAVDRQGLYGPPGDIDSF